MRRSWFVSSATVAVALLVGGFVPSHAGPCTEQIAQVEQQIRQARAAARPGGAGEPSAPQSVGAQLHHQPTPGSVESAERAAQAQAEAALERARQADAANDAVLCARALQEAKALYGLN